MKLFISSDIEGVCGIAHHDEADYKLGGAWYNYFCEQMTREVCAVCEGALKADVDEILVKDAHDTARNINPAALPKGVCINRGWSGNPFSMLAGLADNFDALVCTGYHSAACSDGNPLSHTMHTEVDRILINGEVASEFTIAAYTAGVRGVPLVFVSGDEKLCRQASEMIPAITTVAVSFGEGASSTSMHPELAVEWIREGVEKALKGNLEECIVKLPEKFEVQVRYQNHTTAYQKMFYPGAELIDEKTIGFEHEDFQEVLRFFHFVL